eukprot:TRINITY_DN93292_c0_g1_i1.p1 TRINITY_DN93292_c0_g1~~TRINITY_DN93292_c0_g1_i1.p1  ORF type:complete len:563 (+),score=139.83 TRINITY_DN93292_c0_g1_i1:58-1746(+)
MTASVSISTDKPAQQPDNLTKPVHEVKVPGNHQEWILNTEANLTRAKSLAKDVLQRLRANESEDLANKEAREVSLRRQKEGVKKRVQQKVKVHSEVINNSQKSIRQIEDAIVQVEGVQSRITHERYARFADMKVCERRLELRSKRPARENFRDAVQEALEREKYVLNQARQELLSFEAETKRAHGELQELRAALSHDTGARRLAVHQNLAQLQKSQSSVATASAPVPAVPTPTAASAASGADAAAEPVEAQADNAVSSSMKDNLSESEDKKASATTPTAAESESAKVRQQTLTDSDSKALMQRAQAVCGIVTTVEKAADKSIMRIREDAANSAKRSAKVLQMRTNELQGLKKSVEDNLQNVTQATNEASQAFLREEFKAENMSGELKVAQAARVTELGRMLEDLRATQSALVEEVRLKAAALEIDNSCRRVTAQMASEPRKPTGQKALMKNSRSTPALSSVASTSTGGSCIPSSNNCGSNEKPMLDAIDEEVKARTDKSSDSHEKSERHDKKRQESSAYPMPVKQAQTMKKCCSTAGSSCSLKLAAAASILGPTSPSAVKTK